MDVQKTIKKMLTKHNNIQKTEKSLHCNNGRFGGSELPIKNLTEVSYVSSNIAKIICRFNSNDSYSNQILNSDDITPKLLEFSLHSGKY